MYLGGFFALNPSTTIVYARSAFYPSPRFTLSLQSAFYPSLRFTLSLQSAFTHSLHFIPCPQSAIRSPQSRFTLTGGKILISIDEIDTEKRGILYIF